MTEAAIGGPFFPPCSFSFFVCCSVVGKKSWFNTTAPTRRLSTLQLLNPSRRTCAASNFLLRETLDSPLVLLLLSWQSWSITDWAVAVCLKPPSPLNTKINNHNWVGEHTGWGWFGCDSFESNFASPLLPPQRCDQIFSPRFDSSSACDRKRKHFERTQFGILSCPHLQLSNKGSCCFLLKSWILWINLSAN